MIKTEFNDELILRQFRFSELDEDLWSQYFELTETCFRETNPEDILPDRGRKRDFLLHPHPLWQFRDWLALIPGNRLVGYGGFYFPAEGADLPVENWRTAQFDLIVNPLHRQRGIGTQLFQEICQEARACGIEAFQDEALLESGKRFALHHGGRTLNNRQISRLLLKDINWELVECWCREGPSRANGVRLTLLEVMPQEWLDEYVALYNTIGRIVPDVEAAGFVPLDQTSCEDRRVTEQLVAEKGITYLTILAVEADGTLSGLTETYQGPGQPERIEQSITGVLPLYRRRGLGKWLKAEMLTAIVGRCSGEARFVETGNADQNASMLAINIQLGFRPYLSELQFRIELG